MKDKANHKKVYELETELCSLTKELTGLTAEISVVSRILKDHVNKAMKANKRISKISGELDKLKADNQKL